MDATREPPEYFGKPQLQGQPTVFLAVLIPFWEDLVTE
jgi:hypothetical protein